MTYPLDDAIVLSCSLFPFPFCDDFHLPLLTKKGGRGGKWGNREEMSCIKWIFLYRVMYLAMFNRVGNQSVTCISPL